MDTCGVSPFRYQSTPQDSEEGGASGNQINEQHLEDYLAALQQAVCNDVQALEDSASSTTFLAMTDTPDTYAGSGGWVVKVNGGETGLVFEPESDDDGDGLTLDFSVSEQVTKRKYTNGKPIYQKTIVRAGNLATGDTSIAHGISNLERVVNWFGSAFRSSGGHVPCPFPATTAIGFVFTHQYIDATNIRVSVGASWTGAGNVLSSYNSTIFYTKTTDP